MIHASLLEAVIAGALTAPSGDNCQPWQVVPTERGFALRIVTERCRALLDVDQLASRVAAGAFLEAARLAAGRLGLRATWTLDPDPADSERWADVALDRATEASAAPDGPLAAALGDRHSNRAVFDRSALTATELEALAAERLDGVHVAIASDRRVIAQLAALAGRGERIRAGIQAAHEDLQHWLRWTPAQAEATGDGLDVRTLGIGAAERFALRTLGPWRRMRIALRFGAARGNGRWARRVVASASAVLVIAVPAGDAASAIRAGELLERAWLRATALGLQASVMAALPLLALGAVRGAPEIMPWREPLVGANAELAHVAGLPIGYVPLVMLRVGRAAPAKVRALRRATRAVIDSAGAHSNVPMERAS